MADVILSDGDSGHNHSSNSSSFVDLQLSKRMLALTEDFIHGLGEVRAMLAVAKSGLCACPKVTQHNYLNQIDNIVEGAMLSFIEIVELYRDREEKEEND